MLTPGVISPATNIVEHPELVAQRIVRLARLVGRENVIGGTDCGFAQSPFTQRVHPTIMWAKLKSLWKARASPRTSCGADAPRRNRNIFRCARHPCAGVIPAEQAATAGSLLLARRQ